ncbi:RNA recognition motif 2-domain-containing protein [Papiliotrema laurentii]|uniref:RNA recognition motif 2-domain-containing protein n=1 Tax=Papiliotrema laurentii TaxID=5418 RepID=A0AAD9FRF2_PAPLA|nr:RNA recognition motif 2-domain-containing protein [Papiliotrema laurentii]
MRQLLESFGDLATFRQVGLGRFYDTRDAQTCVEALQGYSFHDARLIVNFHSKDPFATRTAGYTLGSAAYRGGFPAQPLPTPRYDHVESFRRRAEDPAVLQGLLDNMDISARVRHGEGVGGHWDPRDNKRIPEENRVIPERIVAGLDKRTTVMIKDVPNKLSRDELIAVLTEVVPKQFDFVYLRFDFTNCCNVGYAFVNFTSVNALYEFIQAKVGKKWNMFSSEKVLQVSYANIQGKAALVNKFKNSAVMQVLEPWRPRIFYSSGAMKGQPEPFPESDPTIKRRSAWALASG